MEKKFKKLIAMALSFAILATFCTVPMITASAESTNLKFDNNGKFKIVIFSDVQDQFPVSPRVISIMEQAIEREDPDLVVFLGDITEQNIKDPEIDFRRTVEQILAPVVNAGVPYAFVFGNHDDQSYYSGQRTDKDAMLAVYQSIGDCRTVDADPTLFGTGTCKIPIYASNSNDIAFDLFMVDSNTYQYPTESQNGGYDNPHADQLAWLAANEDEGVNSLVFQHIPMPEIYNLLTVDANGEKQYGDTKYAKTLNSNATGHLGEFPCPPHYGNNTGEFAALKAMDGVLGVFTGHDHLNDFTGTCDGLKMTAVPGMTYYNYGEESVRGYGVIELDETDTSNYDYHTVKFSTLDNESGAAGETVFDSYDVVTYSDLKKNGEALPSGEYNIHGSNTFTYNATSPSKSAIFKFRYTVGSDTGIQFSFDEGDNGNISNPFGVWVKKPNQGSAGANGAWHLRPDKSSTLVNMSSAASEGDTFDIEFARLKVLTGEPQHIGQYYIYLKVNGTLIGETYTNTDSLGRYISGNSVCQISNKIRFGDWSANDNNNKISSYVEVAERYEPYDIIKYSDLYTDSSKTTPVNAEGTLLTAQNNNFYYNATSPTHSAIYRVRWVAGNNIYFQLYPGKYCTNPFAYRINTSTWDKKNAPGNTSVNRDYTINEGDIFDLEVGRLMVANGANAGKYYTYFKVNDNVIFEEYVTNSGIAADALFDGIQFNLKDNDGRYCTIKSSDDDFDSEYYDYDEVTYYDLKKNGNNLTEGTTNLSGSMTFTYDATSPTYSAILRFRYIQGTAPSVQFSFDSNGSNICHPFGVWVKTPAQAGPNGAWHLMPHIETKKVLMDTPLQENDYMDIELGRLKVKNGDPSVVGKYYVYLKIDGQLIQEGYSEVDANGFYTSGSNTACRISNKIFFGCWGIEDGQVKHRIGASQNIGEEYAPYDEIYYGALYKNGNPVSSEGSGSSALYTFNQTSATKSAIVKVRWKAANNETEFQMSFDRRGTEAKSENRFGVQVYSYKGDGGDPNGRVWLRPGYGPSMKFKERLVTGTDYDLEFARLMVVSGPNTGRWFMYLKINGKMVACDYVAADVVDENGQYTSNSTTCTLSNELYMSFWSGGGATLTNPPFTETYEDYDEVYYSNLLSGGNSVAANGRAMSGATVFTYDRTSPTYSTVFKYRWTIGSKATCHLSFDRLPGQNMPDYLFGLRFDAPESGHPNGWVWLRTGDGPHVDLPYALVSGNSYDIEYARLKVKTGPNRGKYYLYLKVDGNLVAEDYVAANAVDSEGNYNSKPNTDGAITPCTLSNEIFFAYWGSESNSISNPAFDETYEEYDNIGYSDLILDGLPVPASGLDLTGGTVFNYNRTSDSGSVVFKYRWKIGDKSTFQLSFEKKSASSMAYMFGAWLYEPDSTYTNGKVWLRPSYGPEVNIPSVLSPGSQHNIEFARLKVSNGPNKGKYLVYIKIDDVLVTSEYVAASVVDSEGNYLTRPNEGSNPVQCSVKSGEIFLAFYNNPHNAINAYKASVSSGHLGVVCDFDENGLYSATDLTGLINLLIGKDSSEVPEGMGDFNNDGNENIIDLIAIKKHLIRPNTYTKSGSLTVGTQEHILEDESKTAEYIADASAALGAGIYRLSRPIHTLYYASSTNGAVENTTNMADFEDMVDALNDAGITEILYVSDTFVPAYGYYNSEINHHKTVPDPVTENEYYEQWLEVNANAYAALAAKFEGRIKYFEPFNEINTTGTRFERTGANWSATDQQAAAYKYTVTEKAGIMADLCWNISTAVKSVDPKNQVTTPSICTGSNSSVIQSSFTNALYTAIESGAYPSNRSLGDIRVDNFFTIVNLHIYPQYGTNASQYNANLNTAASDLISIYDVVRAHGDGGSRFWITETGVSSGGRTPETVGDMLYATLNKINTSTTFIDTVIIYKIADMSVYSDADDIEIAYGLFYSADDWDDPYGAKPSAKAVYRFTHGGSTDYSALNSFVAKYKS